nr:FGGY family carbohydrate kinase [uncultured Sphaerochaeta sp.]
MRYIGALDQGTTSTRFIIFDQSGSIVSSYQLEHEQIFVKPGWVEHDPWEIWDNSCECISKALKEVNLKGSDIEGIGITNQREDSHRLESQDRKSLAQCHCLAGSQGIGFD